MLPMSSTTAPKRRQTCDPCRRAKIKCDKRTPICGRCLVTGDLCGYGISRQGAWWRHKGTKKAATQQTAEQEDLEFFDASDANEPTADYASVASLLSSRLLSTTKAFKQSEQDYNLDLELLCLQGDYQFQDLNVSLQTTPNSAELTPKRRVMNSTKSPLLLDSDINEPLISTNHDAGFIGLFPRHGYVGELQSQSVHRRPLRDNTAEIDCDTGVDQNQTSCSCYTMVLQALQALEDSFPQAHARQQSPSSAEVATVMQHNERTLQCCLKVIRCQSCREDNGRSPMVLLLTLIGREILLTEEWACPSPNQAVNSSSYPQPLAIHRDLRIEVAQVGARRLSEMLLGLRQICESLRCDFTRLAHNVLLESLMINLRNASARLTLEGHQDKSTAQQ